MSVVELDLISAGAAKGLVQGAEPALLASADIAVRGQFGAVGTMRDSLLAGAACDVLILTEAMLENLAGEGWVVRETIRPLGRVHTGLAVPACAPLPAVADRESLAAAFVGASAIYCPDVVKATAGIHLRGVLGRLGVLERVAARLRPYPNGATAMRAMADAGDPRAIGCTQVSEILYTPGVVLVGPLPREFELATVYAAARCQRAKQVAAADRAIALLCGPQAAALRERGGFVG